MLDNVFPTLKEIFNNYSVLYTPDVSLQTLRRWWTLYEEWWELPHKVADRKRKMKGNNTSAKKNELLNDADILLLKEIVDENPNLYLNDLVFLFGI